MNIVLDMKLQEMPELCKRRLGMRLKRWQKVKDKEKEQKRGRGGEEDCRGKKGGGEECSLLRMLYTADDGEGRSSESGDGRNSDRA